MAEAPKRSEFERIAQYFAPLTQDFPGAFGLTDDAAVIAPSSGNELVVTTDTIIAGVHYIGTEAPGLIAAKLLRVNLSDIAAKGATPLAYTLNIALPVDLEDDWLAKFTEGLAADQAEFGIVLIGGDSVATPGPVTLTLTAFGEVPVGKALLRRNAKAGDSVFVTGQIGDGAPGPACRAGAVAGYFNCGQCLAGGSVSTTESQGFRRAGIAGIRSCISGRVRWPCCRSWPYYGGIGPFSPYTG